MRVCAASAHTCCARSAVLEMMGEGEEVWNNRWTWEVYCCMWFLEGEEGEEWRTAEEYDRFCAELETDEDGAQWG